MYSLSIQEKLDAERDQNSSREILWRNLRDRKKSGRMVRRIYNKTREEMGQSGRSKCHQWVADATVNMGSWVREPQPSVFQHTFRDRCQEAELGPLNGHVSARKYIPRLAFSAGGELNKEKTIDLKETLLKPSQMRGNDSNALQNPCRPTVTIMDTAKIRGRVKYPHWEPPRYFLRARDKAKEIGPDIQYADRNDMQRIFSGVVKYSLFNWGKFEGGGAWAAPSCRREEPEKWVGDHKFYPGYRYRDNQRETMSGSRLPAYLLTTGEYKKPMGFSRERHPAKELPQHDQFQLVVRNNEYVCPDGHTRRSLRFEEEPPEPYPEVKMYFASLRSVPVTPANGNLPAANLPRTRLRGSVSLESLHGGDGVGAKGLGRDEAGGASISASKSSTIVRFSPGNDQAEGIDTEEDGGGEYYKEVGESVRARAAVKEETVLDAKVAGEMRRGSEMASWATCGIREKSARDYLW